MEQGRLRRQEAAQRVTVGLIRLFPVRLHGRESVRHTLKVGVTILRNDRRNPFGVLDRQAKAYRRAVIEHVDRELFQAKYLGKAANHFSDVLKGIGELISFRLLGHAEARQIRGHDMIVIG